MKKLLLAAAGALISTAALAADLPVQAINKAIAGGYPTKCGFYYGVGTGGSAGAVTGSVVGTQIVQGELDALVGYTCPFAGAAFWFVEGSAGMNNINGNVNGLAMSGPVILQQRVGVGSPVNTLINPFGTSLAVPSLPVLPNGVAVTGTAAPYLFAGIVEQDVSTLLGLDQHAHQWLIAPEVGIGLLTRLTNGAVVDTWAGWQMNSQSFCPGIGSGCAKLGNTGRVGVSFKY